MSPSQAQQAIQTFQDQLRSANIAFNTPTKLELGGSGVVDLQLSMQTALNALRARLGTAGATVVARIQASNVMTASLTSGEFKIQDLSAQTQAVGSPITEWKWEIEPTQPGVLPLYLSMTAVVTVNGRPTNYGVRTFNRTLLVRSVPVAWYTKVTRYLSGNWAWIAGLLGALAAALRALTRRREAMPGDADRARTPSPNGRQHVGDGSPRLPTRVPGNPDRHRSHGTRRR